MMKKIKTRQRPAEEQIICANALIGASRLISGVLAECGLDQKKEPEKYRFLRNMLREQTDKRIVFSIWSAIEDKHVEHFRSFMDLAMKINRNVSHEAVLVEFALLYPEISARVFESLNTFFDQFVENYEKVYKK